MFFCDWLISLCTMSSGFTPVVADARMSFLFKASIFHCVDMYVYSFDCQWTFIFSPTFWLL